MRPKKIRQNSLSLKLDLDRLNGLLMAYIYFYNLNLIAEGILILCMSLFYTKWRKGNFFYEFWAILYDSLFHLRYKFYTMRPKKIRQNSLSLNLDLDRLNGILMAYIYYLQSKFDNRRNFYSLHVSVLYKMTQRWFFW